MAAVQLIPPGFLERARREAARYGDDPWILLRELVQNSRDAGAAHIAIAASTDDGGDALTCTDDGRGMTRAEMRAYLLRLYASGKAPPRGQSSEDRARGPVGRFGVGFWSVLRFSPAVVRVESRAGGEGTAFEVDCEAGVLREVPCALAERGTRVTLTRPTTGEPFVDVAEERLVRWAGAVRGVAGGRPPTLTFNGAVRNTPFVEPELIAERFVGRGFDGVIGFGHRPSVSLYAHGLLLREAGSLEELLPRRAARVEGAPGLHPVVRVNADGLEVLMNRREVVEDRLLDDLVTTCERRLRRLERQLLDRLARLRLLDRLRVAAPRLAPLAFVVALLGLVGVGAAIGRYAIGGPARTHEPAVTVLPLAPPSSSPRSTTDLEVGAAPRINQPSGLPAGDKWDVRVDAADGGLHLLKLTTLSRFDAGGGLVGEPAVASGEPAWGRRAASSLTLDVGLHAAASLARLPIPSGHGLVRGSVLVDGAPAAVRGGLDGEPLLPLTGSERRVRYTTGPAREPSARPSLLGAPPTWPADAAAVIARAKRRPPSERARLLESFVKKRVRYSTSLDDAARFDAAAGSFVERTLALGVGDCDVMNALFALLLRSAGVPARVAVGLVVHGDEIAPDLHAWTEYFAGGEWRSLDVSPPLPVDGGAPLAHGHTHGHTHAPIAADAPTTSEGADTAALPTPASAPPLDDARDALSHPEHVANALAQPILDDDRGTAPLVSRTPLLVGALGALALVVGLVLWRLRAQRPRDGDDEALAALLERWLSGPRGADPLHLRLRPFFPVLGRRRLLSLADLEKRAASGLLFAAPADDSLVPQLRRSAAVLDVSPPAIAKLLPLLPEALRLDALSAALDAALHDPARDPLLDEVEAVLRRTDDDVRVLSLAGATGVQEVEIPAKGAIASRYLLVGEADPRWRQLTSDDAPTRDDGRALSLAVRFLLEHTTLYREQRAAILARLVGGRGATP